MNKFLKAISHGTLSMRRERTPALAHVQAAAAMPVPTRTDGIVSSSPGPHALGTVTTKQTAFRLLILTACCQEAVGTTFSPSTEPAVWELREGRERKGAVLIEFNLELNLY